MVTHSIENKKITFFVEGFIDSTNAQEIDDYITQVLDSNEHDGVYVDLAKTTYVSSAGLRIFLKISKKEATFAVKNVSNEIYSVFEMTGFTSIMTIEKALPKLSLENAKLIGTGYFSDVYRIDRDNIVKVFKRSHDLNDVKRELDLAKHAFLLGIPTAISYGVVDADGRLGVVFEMLDCTPLRDLIRDDEANREKWIKEYAKLLKTINTTDAADTVLPNYNEEAKKCFSIYKDLVSTEDYETISKLLDSIPQKHTFVHGDCHIKNILVNSKGEFFVIDMDTLSYGNPIFELSAFYSTYVIFEETEPGNVERFMEISEQLSSYLFYRTLDYYFEDKTEEVKQENIKKVKLLGYLFMMFWTTKNEGEEGKYRFDLAYSKAKELFKEVKDLELK